MFLEDRRTKKRESVGTLAEFKVLRIPSKAGKPNVPGTWIKAPLLDISLIGCALRSPYAIPPFVTVLVKIDPLAFALEASEKRKEALEMTGKIAYCAAKGPQDYRIGISFTKIKQKDSGLIKRFIKVKERRKFPRWDMT